MSNFPEYNIPIWPGSSSFATGSTPFGYYDSDSLFQQDADKVAFWAATKLGYPITDVELQDVNFYSCFEEAITEYSAQINLSNIKDHMLNLIGAPTGSSLNGKVISNSLNYQIVLATDYGAEAGSGGNLQWHTGSIDVKAGVQRYNLNELFRDVKEPGEIIEIKKLFHYQPAAIVRYFDPFLDTALGSSGLLNEFGFGNFSPAVTYLMMPMFADLLRLQAIEINDQIRKSSYSFRMINNELQLFPIPLRDTKLHFEYIKRSERANVVKPVTGTSTDGFISDASNVPYSNIEYHKINAPGRRWIFKYTAALAKEMLGWIRTKYAQIPIPNAEVSLNGSDLLSDARTEKDALVEELRKDLEELSRRMQMEKKNDESKFLQEQLNRIPLRIYIGAVLPFVMMIGLL